MNYFRRSRFFRLAILPLTLIVWVSACTVTRTVAMNRPHETIAREAPDKVIVTLEDGSRRHVRGPWIEADSLFGYVYDARNRTYSDTVRFALADITEFEERKKETSSGRTVALVVGLIAVSVAATVIFFQALEEGIAASLSGN